MCIAVSTQSSESLKLVPNCNVNKNNYKKFTAITKVIAGIKKTVVVLN